MRSRACLIEAGNGHTVLSVTRNRAQRFGLRRVHISAMTTAMPVMTIVAFQVEGAAYLAGKDFIAGQIVRVFTQLSEVTGCYLFFDLIPPLRTLAQRVGLLAHYLNHVLTGGCACVILHRWRQDEQYWLIQGCDATMKVVTHVQLALCRLRYACPHQFQRAVISGKSRWFLCGVMGHK